MLFHLHANHHQRKNCIPSLLVDGRTITHEDEKAITTEDRSVRGPVDGRSWL
jgi:hypothetical protein